MKKSKTLFDEAKENDNKEIEKPEFNTYTVNFLLSDVQKRVTKHVN